MVNLISVALPSNAVIDYIIDGRNRRVAKKVDGVISYRFIYQDQLNPVAKVDADGNLVEQYVYGSKINIPDYIIRDGEKYSVISDHLGSPRLVVKVSDGSVMQKMNYSEFGVMTNVFTALGFDKIPFGFAGGIYDVQTGLIRFGARDYSAKTGRWTAKDQIRFNGGTANLYEYVNGDPINFIDPSGFCPEDSWSDGMMDWLSRWWDQTLENYKLTNDIVFGTPIKFVVKSVAGYFLTKKITETFGTISTGQALKSLLKPQAMKGVGFSRGVATLGAGGTVAAAAATTVGKIFLLSLAAQGGILAGAMISGAIMM